MESSSTPGPGAPQIPPLAPSPPQILSQEELERVHRYFADWTANAFAESMEFTNKMSFAGYTGGFATWLLLKSYLSPSASLWVGSLLLISLASFVGWNVFNMIWMTFQRLRYHEQLKGIPANAVQRRHQLLEAETQRRLTDLYLPAWGTVVIVCGATAFLAFGILLVNCAVSLMQLSV